MLTLRNVKEELGRKLTPKETIKWLRSAGVLTAGGNYKLGDYSKIINKWYNQPVYVIGTGPTLKPFIKKFGWNYFNDKNTIGINHLVEDYDNIDMLFFLDKRFIEKTTYDLENFQGLIVAQNNTGLISSDNIITFKTRSDFPGNNIYDGLYSSNLSGLAALHLAIFTGANPIYLVGHGMGESNPENYHYKSDYTGELKTDEKFKKFYRVRTYFNNFSQWKRKIFSVSDYNEFGAIKNIPLNEFKEKPLKVIGRLPRILHLSFSPDLARHAETTKQQVCNGYGIHKLLDFKNIDKFEADLYVLNHFLSTDNLIKNFSEKHKAIDIVHTRNCIPNNQFRKVIAMSDFWKKELIENGIDKNIIRVIKSCIDTNSYTELPGYGNMTFGRITRWFTGKIPEWWNQFLIDFFNKYPDSKCKMFIQRINQKPDFLNHNQMEYDENVYIFENKNQYLKQLSVYVHANGFFREISPHAILEAMATGLPIIYLHENSIEEMIGPAGIPCYNKEELFLQLEKMLTNKDKQIEYGLQSKKQVKKYDAKIMLDAYNNVIEETLEEIWN